MNRALIPFTGEHFAAFCRKMVGQPYWFGTGLYKCTDSLLSRKTAQYPTHYKAERTKQCRQNIADKKVCADCVGGLKGYAWTNGGIGVLESIGTDKPIVSKYQSNGCPDKGADSMFAYAKQKGMDWGEIGTLPEVLGIAVHKPGHVGYYVGNGEVVEWKGFASGCVKSKLAGAKWTHWYALPFIQYGSVGAAMPEKVPSQEQVDVPTGTRILRYYSGDAILRGDDVLALQRNLSALGYAVGTLDGIFGIKTDAAVRTFQRDYAMEVNGIATDSVRFTLQKAAEAAQNQYPESPPSVGKNPVFIRIQMTRSQNVAVYGTGEVMLDIEEYLRGVVPAEMYESSDLEALKAQAICARTYAYRRKDMLLTDTSKHQAFDASKVGRALRSDEAIRATAGQVLTHGGKLVDCFYSASNKGQTKRSGDVWRTHYPYYVSKPDEWDDAARSERNITASGHGVGMSQHGAMWAARKGVRCKSILAFYYEGATITDNYNT